MIKINLALRKTSQTSEKGEGRTFAFSKTSLKFNAEFLKDQQFRKVALAAIAGFVGYMVVDGLKDEELKKWEVAMQRLEGENATLQAKYEKTKAYEPIKRQLEEDEATIRNKLETVQKLIADRQIPPKMLASVSTGIPADVWLTDFQLNDQDLRIKGVSLGLNQVSDFMSTLDKNAYVSDVKLVSEATVKDEITGTDVSSFELGARKK